MIIASKFRGIVSCAGISACGLALCVSAGASAEPTSGACDFSGNWTINGNYKISANENIDAGPKPQHLKVKFTRDSDSAYTGHYVEMDNTSVFTLRIFTSPTGRGQVGDMVQNGVAQSGYYAVYIGHVATSCEIQGTWIDVANNSGDFKLTRH